MRAATKCICVAAAKNPSEDTMQALSSALRYMTRDAAGREHVSNPDESSTILCMFHLLNACGMSAGGCKLHLLLAITLTRKTSRPKRNANTSPNPVLSVPRVNVPTETVRVLE